MYHVIVGLMTLVLHLKLISIACFYKTYIAIVADLLI